MMASKWEIWHYNTDTQKLIGTAPVKVCNTLAEACEHGERVFQDLQKLAPLTDNIGVELVEVDA